MPPAKADPDFLARFEMTLMPHTSIAPSLAGHQVVCYTVNTRIHATPLVPCHAMPWLAGQTGNYVGGHESSVGTGSGSNSHASIITVISIKVQQVSPKHL